MNISLTLVLSLNINYHAGHPFSFCRGTGKERQKRSQKTRYGGDQVDETHCKVLGEQNYHMVPFQYYCFYKGITLQRC